ncbi:hypothetical protein BGX34_008362 [Mortierella sp. NVP85]|nr:hypothetical protein BGX34_008362 [Mortierella sp. NVP85]
MLRTDGVEVLEPESLTLQKLFQAKKVVAASFCALDPRKTNVVKNLLVKRSALYTPALLFRSHRQMLKSASGIKTIGNSLKRHNCESVVEVESEVKYLYGALKQLNELYGSKRLKKMTWEKPSRALFNILTNLTPLHGTWERFFYTKIDMTGSPALRRPVIMEISTPIDDTATEQSPSTHDSAAEQSSSTNSAANHPSSTNDSSSTN